MHWLRAALTALIVVVGAVMMVSADSPPNFERMWGWGVDDGTVVFQTCTSGCQAGISGSGNGQFAHPIDVAVDSSGNVYVLDRDNHRIQKFTSTGSYLTQWGSLGSGDGQLDTPYGIGVDSSGNVYVADTNNSRIQKFDSSGNFERMWGWGVDDGTAAFQICTNACQAGITGDGDGQFNQHLAVSVDSSGNVYIADTSNHRIQKFSNTGTFLAKWGSFGFSPATGVFYFPWRVGVDSSGNVYISDAFNHRVQKFDSSGNFLTTWGSLGSGNGQFVYTTGIAVDSMGNVYVADLNNRRIQKFTSTGTFLTKWGSFGSTEGKFNVARGVAVDSVGNVYVADGNNNRIQKFGASTFTLTVTGAGTGAGTVTATNINCSISAGSASNDCSEAYTNGTVVAVTATAGANSVFAGWSNCSTSTDSPINVTMDADKTCTATFNLVNRTLTVAGAGTGLGTVTATGINCSINAGVTSGDCTETVTHGTNIVPTATAGTKSAFVGWTNCDSPSGNQCTMTMNADKTLTATFTPEDYDGDGLLYAWETAGVTVDPDFGGPLPAQFIDLPAMGADPNKPDIFLHIDWMKNDSHSHKLNPVAIKKIVDSFAASPYTSPTGSVGINLHVDQGPDSILNFTTNATWGALSRARELTHVDTLGAAAGGGYSWSEFDAIKNAAGGFTQSGRAPVFHYVISAHNYCCGTSSGLSRGIGASDFIVSLGSFPGNGSDINHQAGTLMHELGHNLGLRHGGSDNTNYKPNYLSIMNYSFQLRGLIKNKTEFNFDYSRWNLGNFNESNFNEGTGLNAPAAEGYGTRYSCATGTPKKRYAFDVNKPIDWNCNGSTIDTGVSTDTNEDTATSSLSSFDDWANLKFNGGVIGKGLDITDPPPPLPMETEEDPLTVEESQKILPLGTLITATKEDSDPNGNPYKPGDTIKYTVVLTNPGVLDQPDNADDEFTDTITSVTMLNAAGTASSGTLTVNPSIKKVTWNGTIPAGGSVTLTFSVRIPPGMPNGTRLCNQGLVLFDMDGNGSNETQVLTADPTPLAGAPTGQTCSDVGIAGFERPILCGMRCLSVSDDLKRKEIAIRFFNLSGKQLYASGWRKALDTRKLESLERRLANGVYLYLIQVKDAEGKVQTQLKKLIIQR
jgi:hypothetical protein